MSDGLPYADIVILALIAGFILLRLRSVLGQKMGPDQQPGFEQRPQDEQSPIVQMAASAARQLAEDKTKDEQVLADIESAAVRDGLRLIKVQDREFSASGFLTGAKSAFEMVFDAFNKDDRDTLKTLLAPEIYNLFASELDRRKTEESYSETTLLAVVSEEITAATLTKSVARISVRFVSEQVTLTRGKKGEILEGDPKASENAESEWTFERDTASRNPNWKIIDT
jgi:predicted lipid-binding transport protein (Tim44 family)